MSKVLINFTTKVVSEATKLSSKAKASKVINLRGKALDDLVSFSTKAELSENLLARTTPAQRTKLQELYSYFRKISTNKIIHPKSNILEKGDLLHAQEYNPATIRETLKNGLISGDIGKLRPPNGDQRTIGGIDTWVNENSRSIKEYFHNWLSTPPEDAKTKMSWREFTWRGENKWMDLAKGGKKQRKIAYVVSPSKNPELNEIVKYKVTPKTKDLPETLMGGKMTSGMYETPEYKRHTFIPVGIPGNYIGKIIVGDKITVDEIKEIKQIISELGLNTKIFDTLGNLL